MRRWCGSRRSPYGSLWPKRWRTSGTTCPKALTRPLRCRSEKRCIRFLPRILPIRDLQGATVGAAVLLEDITRFRLLDDVKSNLVATVSHELKTPLTSIRLALHLLLEETLGPLSPKQLELLVDARDNSERLLVMINNLLDLARLEQGRAQLHLRPERPAALLQSAIESFHPRAEDRGIDLSTDAAGDLPLVAVDADQFQHALHNLLDNALIHTPPGGKITLSADLGKGDRSNLCDDQRRPTLRVGARSVPAGEPFRQIEPVPFSGRGSVVFSVTDTGRGIPAQYLPLVFERYFRVPEDPTEGGSGLGLAIVREIITAHGGAVQCESRPGEKTVFRMTLPVWTAEAAANSMTWQG